MEHEALEKAPAADEDSQLEADQELEADGKKKRPSVWLAVVSSLSSEVSLLKAATLKELQEAIKNIELGTEVCEVYRAIPKQFSVKTTVVKKLEIV